MASFIRSLSRRLTGAHKPPRREIPNNININNNNNSQKSDKTKSHCKILLLDGTDLTIAVSVSCFYLFTLIHKHLPFYSFYQQTLI
jgi:hypothetical protein